MSDPVAWTPTQLSCAVWFDASDSDTVIISDSKVTEWRDKSGNNRHATQETGSLQPALSASQLNSLNTILFNNHRLVTPEFANPSGATGVTVFLVARNNAVPNSANMPLVKGAINTQWSFVWRNNTGASGERNKSLLRHTTDVQLISSRNLGTAWEVISGVISSSAREQRFNGNLDSSAGAATVDFGADSELYIGQPSGTGNHVNADMAEILVIHGVLSTEDRERLEGYLAHKWGLTANLDASHPYKSEAPTYIPEPDPEPGPDPIEPVVATLVTNADREHVTLTSWAGDADFGVTPASGDQIEYPDTIAVSASGVVTGDDGTYTLRLIKGGTVYAVSYEIGEEVEPGPVVSTQATLVTNTGREYVTLTSWAGVLDFGATPSAGDQIEYPEEITVTNEGVITGDEGTYTLRLVKSGTVYGASLVIGGVVEPEDVETSGTLLLPAGMSSVVITAWEGSVSFPVSVASGAVLIYPSSLSASANGVITGDYGDYSVSLVQDGTVYTSAFSIQESVEPVSVQAEYVVPAGYSLVTLSGSVASDPAFSEQPVSGDQIAHPSALSVTSQLEITGDAGSYTIYHVQQDGATYGLSYAISDGVPVSAEDQSLIVPSGMEARTLTSWTGDAQFPVTPSSGAVLIHPDSLTVSANGQIDGDEGTYSITLVQAGTAYSVQYVIEEAQPPVQGDYSTTATLIAPSGHAIVTLAEGFDDYIFQAWPENTPDAGWQIIYPTANSTTINSNGDLETAATAAFDVWAVALDGEWYGSEIDPTELDEYEQPEPVRNIPRIVTVLMQNQVI